MSKYSKRFTTFNLYIRGFVHVFLLILIVLIGIAGIGYFAFKNGQIRPNADHPLDENNTSPNPLLYTPTPSISVSDTSNWKLYENDDYNFSFKYPKGATVMEVNNKYITVSKIEDNPSNSYVISIFVIENFKQETNEQVFAQRANISNIDLKTHVDIEEMSLSNFDTTRFVQDSDNFKYQSLPYTNYLTAGNDLTIHIVTSEYSGKFDGKNTQVFENSTSLEIPQILSTFKFTIEQKTCEIGKIYEN